MNSRRIIFATGLASVVASLSSVAYLRSLQNDAAKGLGVPDEDEQITYTAPLQSYTQALGRRLARLSPFDTAVGGVMLGVLPIVDVSEVDRTRFRGLWERVIASHYFPHDDAGIEWRRFLWSKVRWPEQTRGGRVRTSSAMDSYAARWFIDGSPYVVGGSYNRNSVCITISLTDNNRLHLRYPSMEEMDKAPFRAIVKEFDKTRLHAILTTVFQFPWQTVNDFVVTCSASPKQPSGHLRIDPSQPRQAGEPRDWFDEVSLRIGDGDPQQVSISVFFPDQ